MATEGLSIGMLARAANVNVETVRYYQRRGLLDIPQKNPRGQRRYSQQLLDRLHFIKRAQASGLSLKEIDALLRFDKKADCGSMKAMIHSRLDTISREIEKLTYIKKTFCTLMKECNGSGCHDGCFVMETFSEI